MIVANINISSVGYFQFKPSFYYNNGFVDGGRASLKKQQTTCENVEYDSKNGYYDFS